jgi:hypothetical protein
MSRDKRLNRTQEVVGSIPISSTKIPFSPSQSEFCDASRQIMLACAKCLVHRV